MSDPFDEPVHVIGLGTVGSRIVQELCKRYQPPKALHLWDYDAVAYGNERAQLYDARHYKKPKTEALAEQMADWGGPIPTLHQIEITSAVPLSGVVFVCVDTMRARKNIWEHSIRGNRAVSLMIEIGIERTSALIHVVNPNHERHCVQWEHYWRPDAAPNRSCGMQTSLGPIAALTASLALWELVPYWNRKPEGTYVVPTNQIRIYTLPTRIEQYQW